jgi:hypothetical protein
LGTRRDWLLTGLRDADARTSLSTAQNALARQYGFRTWTELKATR